MQCRCQKHFYASWPMILGVIGCFGDGEPGWRVGTWWWDACSNRVPSRVWLSLLLVRYEMWSCLVACMDKSFECVTHEPLYHGCIVSSCIARKVEIEKTEPCGMVEGSGMKRSRQSVRGGEPNTTYKWVKAGKWCKNGLVRATNQPHRSCHMETVPPRSHFNSTLILSVVYLNDCLCHHGK